MSFPFFSSFLWFEVIDFPYKLVPCRFNLNFSLFGFEPSFKGCGFNLWLSILFHWTMDLKPSSKMAQVEMGEATPLEKQQQHYRPWPCDPKIPNPTYKHVIRQSRNLGL